MSRRHLQVIRANDNLRTHMALVGAQDWLVGIAAEPWKEFNEAFRYWLAAADPDGEEPKDQLERRGVSAKRRGDGTVKGSFVLDPLEGTAFLNSLSQESDRLWRQDQETGVERTARQRSADALVNLVKRGAKRKNGSLPAPLIHLVMSPQVAADALIRIECEAAGIPLPEGIDPWKLPVRHGDHRRSL